MAAPIYTAQFISRRKVHINAPSGNLWVILDAKLSENEWQFVERVMFYLAELNGVDLDAECMDEDDDEDGTAGFLHHSFWEK